MTPNISRNPDGKSPRPKTNREKLDAIAEKTAAYFGGTQGQSPAQAASNTTGPSSRSTPPPPEPQTQQEKLAAIAEKTAKAFYDPTLDQSALQSPEPHTTEQPPPLAKPQPQQEQLQALAMKTALAFHPKTDQDTPLAQIYPQQTAQQN